MPDLYLVNIEKQYPGKNKKETVFSLQSVNVSVREGEFFALLGPSGCGKTTLLKLVAGLLSPDQGEIRLGIESITSLPAEQRGIGMVFQEALLFPHMTVLDNVAFGLKMQGISRRERLKKAGHMLDAVGLSNFGSRYPSELSGGQQQRVSLARAIVIKPKLLLMDEPFSALDPGLRGEMRDLVKRIHREFAITILFVTHDREEAFLLADRTCVMKNGKILQVAAPRDLYEKPDNLEVALFMGSKNVIRGEIREGDFFADGLKIELDDHARAKKFGLQGWLVVRPESLSLIPMDENGKIEDHQNWRSLNGTVENISFRQGLCHIHVSVVSVVLEVLEKSSTVPLLRLGDKVSLRFDIRHARFIPNLH